ncbi:hypothetical protein [Bradyrhizobium sp. SZCCHNRI2010]|uniref:hypothetical protein n=1 Tax=Bradyrhizobium sp. SZCCHNRI2010 TaxID=3057283 RepID=UPI0028E25F20|nr:hypothetical protein [Bradyrhizobium sp. SZCCHNRI2010]
MRIDIRAPRLGWAPGKYLCQCRGDGCRSKAVIDRLFSGDKRAWMCADCAYAAPDPLPVDPVQAAIDILISDNPDRWEQTLLRPELLGWFVGQSMKKLRGWCNPDDVFERIMAKARMSA